MRINKSTNHAIRILIECAHANDQLTKVADLSERLDITPQNTFKIVHILSRAGFLEAMRGRNGGVRLAKPAADIRIGEVVRQIEAGLDQDRNTSTPVDRGFGSLVDDALAAFLEVLDGQTLADMKTKNRKAPVQKTKRKTTSAITGSPAGKARKAASKRASSART